MKEYPSPNELARAQPEWPTAEKAIREWCSRREGSVSNPDTILDAVVWNDLSSYFSFVHGGVYHGVETDGHIHT